MRSRIFSPSSYLVSDQTAGTGRLKQASVTSRLVAVTIPSTGVARVRACVNQSTKGWRVCLSVQSVGVEMIVVWTEEPRRR